MIIDNIFTYKIFMIKKLKIQLYLVIKMNSKLIDIELNYLTYKYLK